MPTHRNRPTADWPIFGTLQYGSRYWEGSLDLPPFRAPFPIIIRALREGPTPAQTAAIRGKASADMVDMHRQSGLLPSDPGPEPAAIWQHLLPWQIEVSDAAYYGNGQITVLIILESTQHCDLVPAIETADGDYVGVLPGT